MSACMPSAIVHLSRYCHHYAPTADSARCRSPGARYLNSTAAKYLFRADRVAEATKMAARFTKDGEQANNLYDMQCTWYEIECGSAHLRLHELGQVGASASSVQLQSS